MPGIDASDLNPLHYEDYREFLRATLERRMERNRFYSLRAFARDLDIAPQVLSSVLKGKKGISSSVARLIAEKLKLEDLEKDYLVDLTESVHSRSKLARSAALSRLKILREKKGFTPLSVEKFLMISDWPHFAIMELTFVKGFTSDVEWIAKRLEIDSSRARDCVERLVRLGLLEQTEAGLKKTNAHLTTGDGGVLTAIQAFNHQALKLAAIALDQQPLEARDYSTVTMAIDPTLIPEARKRIVKFQQELCDFLESGSKRTQVYMLASQLFRIGAEN